MTVVEEEKGPDFEVVLERPELVLSEDGVLRGVFSVFWSLRLVPFWMSLVTCLPFSVTPGLSVEAPELLPSSPSLPDPQVTRRAHYLPRKFTSSSSSGSLLKMTW